LGCLAPPRLAADSSLSLGQSVDKQRAVKIDYEEFPVGPALGPHLRCLWELRGSASDSSPQLIVPDGCMELVLNFADPFEQLDADDRPHRQPMILVVGEVRRPVRTRPTGQIDLLGVRFTPGSAPLFLGTPASKLVDRLTDQSGVESASLRAAVDTIFDVDASKRRQLLMTALDAELVRAGALKVAVIKPVALLLEREGMIEISELEALTGMKKRTLERRFAETVGCPPKALAQVLRFRRVLRSIEAHDVDWADTAAECGYFDQAHLVRDFRRYTGLTPGKYLKADHPLTALFDGVRPT
jgi:AraC-like DNA-binding protein